MVPAVVFFISLLSESSRYGRIYDTAVFIVLALFTTCGRNIFPAPNNSPTLFIPPSNGPSIISITFPYSVLDSSISASNQVDIPFTRLCSILLLILVFLHSSVAVDSFFFPSNLSATSIILSVASSRLFNTRSSSLSSNSGAISSYTSS